MTKGKKDIEPFLGGDGMSIVLIDRDRPRTDRRRLGDTETTRYPCIVLAFDLCSSSKIMEDVLLNDKFRDYKAFLTCIKRWLIDRAEKQPPTNDCFELYKFTGDGWILLFPTTTSGEVLLEFMRGLCEMVSAELARHIMPNLSSKPAVLGATLGVETGSLVKMTMNDRDEYVGRALNIACRLQNAVKENEPSPAYKALVSAPLYNASLSQLTVPYKVEPVTLPLRNILSGSGFDCWRIDFTVDGYRSRIAVARATDLGLDLRTLKLERLAVTQVRTSVYGPLLVCKLAGIGLRGTTAHVYPASYCVIEYSTSGHNGLFARQFPIASSTLMASDILGFV